MDNRAVGADVSVRTGTVPEFCVMAVGEMKLEDLGPVPRKVSQTCDNRLKARTVEKLNEVLPAGMLFTTW